MNLLELGLSLRAAVAVHGEAVVALEFLDGGFEGISVGAIEYAGKITKIV